MDHSGHSQRRATTEHDGVLERGEKRSESSRGDHELMHGQMGGEGDEAKEEEEDVWQNKNNP